MPLIEKLPLEQKGRIYDFWAAAFKGVGVEPVVTLNPPSWLFLDINSVDMNQVEALRAIAAKYLSFADRLEAEVRRTQTVTPEDNGAGNEDDMPPPLVEVPRRRSRMAPGTDGRGGPVPPPVAPRVRGER